MPRENSAAFGHDPQSDKPSVIPAPYQLLILSTLAAIILLRTGFSFPSFLFGDDTAFYYDAYTAPAKSIFLPYAGYPQLLCRALAFCYHTLPIQLVTRLYFITPSMIVLGIAAIILNLRWIERKERIFLAIATVVLPSQSEVFSHLCNANWTASLLLLFILLSPVLGSFSVRSLGAIVIATILGLSNPYVPILFPLFTLRWLCKRKCSKSETLLFLAVAITSILQVYFILNSGLTMAKTNCIVKDAFAPIFNPALTWFNALCILPLSCFLSSCSLLQRAVHNIHVFIPLASYILLALLTIAYLWHKSDAVTQKQSLLLFAIGYYLVLACSIRTANAPHLYLAMKGADRYFYLPYFCFTAALLKIFLSSNQHRFKRILQSFILASLCLFYMLEFPIPVIKNESWGVQYEKLQRTGHWDYSPQNGMLLTD